MNVQVALTFNITNSLQKQTDGPSFHLREENVTVCKGKLLEY